MATTEQNKVESQEAVGSREILSRPAGKADHRISYGVESEQFGDLRLPAGAGPFPVVVVIHGGCWRARHSLDYMGHLCADLTAAGIATWNIEYRRLGQDGGGWPGTYLDVARGLDHLRHLAAEFPLDLQRVVVTGHSAGGHLALWAAGRPQIPPESELYLPEPQAIAGVAPIAGLTDLARTGTACDEEVPQMRGPVGTARVTSPIEMLPLGVPVTILQGDEDEPVPPIHATSYLEAAEASGDRPRMILLSGVDHFVVVDPLSSVWPRIRAEILSLIPR